MKPATRYLPPNELQDKIGGPLPDDNPQAIATANNNIARLSDNFQSWLESEINSLDEAMAHFTTAENGVGKIHMCAHDLKGLATTYGYPLIGRISGSLSRLSMPGVDDDSYAPPLKLLKAHVEAIKIAARDQIKDNEHDIASSLADELEKQTSQYLSSGRDK